jgi:hypothetical protein
MWRVSILNQELQQLESRVLYWDWILHVRHSTKICEWMETLAMPSSEVHFIHLEFSCLSYRSPTRPAFCETSVHTLVVGDGFTIANLLIIRPNACMTGSFIWLGFTRHVFLRSNTQHFISALQSWSEELRFYSIDTHFSSTKIVIFNWLNSCIILH